MLEAKLLAGNSGYDVVVPTSNFLQRQIAADVYLPLDKSKLPNLKNMDPALMEKAPAYDPGNEHAVIYMWGTIGIGYNKAKVEERLGEDAPVDSWTLVFDPEYAAKLADCGITMLDSLDRHAADRALAYLGLDPRPPSADDMREGGGPARCRCGPTSATSTRRSTSPTSRTARSAWRSASRATSTSPRRGPRRRRTASRSPTACPTEGTQLWFDMMAIPADAPNPEAAYKWINFIMEPQITADITNYVSYANANAASMPLVDEAVKNDPSIFPPPEVMAKLFPTVTYGPKVDRTITRLWTKVRTGQ